MQILIKYMKNLQIFLLKINKMKKKMKLAKNRKGQRFLIFFRVH